MAELSPLRSAVYVAVVCIAAAVTVAVAVFETPYFIAVAVGAIGATCLYWAYRYARVGKLLFAGLCAVYFVIVAGAAWTTSPMWWVQ